MSITGNLRTMPFADLVQWLSASEKTGTLVIDGLRYTKKAYFSQGLVVAIASDNPEEMLGYYLVGWGFLSDQQLQELIDVQDQFGVMLGELVVKKGHVSREELNHLMLVKTEENIYDLITWQEGNFRFLEGQLPERDFLEIQLPAERFLMEGFRQRDERLRMKEVIPDDQHIPTATGELDLGALNSQELMIVQAVDGTMSITKIALACRLPRFVVLACVYRCIKQGSMRLSPPLESGELTPGQSHAPWHEMAIDVQDRLQRGRLLDALELIKALGEKYSTHRDAPEYISSIKEQIAEELDQSAVAPGAVLEPAAGLDELMNLDCAPYEGFVLSRISGFYSVQEVLSQLPGAPLHNRTILHNLLRRGLVKLRKVTALKRFKSVPGRPEVNPEVNPDDVAAVRLDVPDDAG